MPYAQPVMCVYIWRRCYNSDKFKKKVVPPLDIETELKAITPKLIVFYIQVAKVQFCSSLFTSLISINSEANFSHFSLASEENADGWDL